jgi:hypothetical protein
MTLEKRTAGKSMSTGVIGKKMTGDDTKSHLELDDMMMDMKQQKWVRAIRRLKFTRNNVRGNGRCGRFPTRGPFATPRRILCSEIGL